MGDEILSLAKKTGEHLALVFYLPNKQKTVYRDKHPVVSPKLQRACVFVKHLNFKDLILENTVDHMEMDKPTWEEQYQEILDKLSAMDCCEQCKLVMEDLCQRTFLIDNRQEFIEHVKEIKVHKASLVLPKPVMLLEYNDDSYMESIEAIKDVIIEKVDVEETTYFFALEHWDPDEEEYKVYVKYKNDTENPDIQFLADLLN